MNNKFFTFIKPYLSYIDNGHLYRKPFSWLYALIAIANFALPIYIFYEAVDNHIFDADGKYVSLFLLIMAIISFASWVGFQLWWDRKSKVLLTSQKGDEFVAVAVLSHFIQTAGEWLGTWIIIVGTSSAILTTIILSGENGGGHYFSRSIGLDFIGGGALAIIIMPIYGFLIIVISRFFAEQFRAFASIANNTKKTKNDIINEYANPFVNIDDGVNHSANESKFCSSCGKKIEDLSSQFCESCGIKFK